MRRVMCKACAKARRVLPPSLRRKLENLERKMLDRKSAEEKSNEGRKAEA